MLSIIPSSSKKKKMMSHEGFGIPFRAFVLSSNHFQRLPRYDQLNLELSLVIYDVRIPFIVFFKRRKDLSLS